VPGVGRRTATAVHEALAKAAVGVPAVDPTTGEIVELATDTDPLRVGGFEQSP
jgi:hypothetical protein